MDPFKRNPNPKTPNSRDLVLVALRSHGGALAFASQALRSDRGSFKGSFKEYCKGSIGFRDLRI